MRWPREATSRLRDRTRHRERSWTRSPLTGTDGIRSRWRHMKKGRRQCLRPAVTWWAMRDSNPRPCACKAPALATAPIARRHGKCSTGQPTAHSTTACSRPVAPTVRDQPGRDATRHPQRCVCSPPSPRRATGPAHRTRRPSISPTTVPPSRAAYTWNVEYAPAQPGRTLGDVS